MIFWSCTKEKSLVFSNEKYEKFSTTQEDKTFAKIAIDLPLATSKGIISDSINTTVYKFTENIISLEDKPIVSSNYDELATSFITSYDNLKDKYPEEIGWEANIKGEVTFQAKNLLNIRIEYYIFTGGAHGYFGVKSLLFDTQTGKQLTQEDLFSNIAEFTLFAENKFRNKFRISSHQNINSKGFMFENDFFHLPENIFFTQDGVLLIYNTYEIASYADGIQELHIPLAEIKPFLKFEVTN